MFQRSFDFVNKQLPYDTPCDKKNRLGVKICRKRVLRI